MEDIITKIVDFIYFVINTIKGLVASLKGDAEDTTAPDDDNTAVA